MDRRESLRGTMERTQVVKEDPAQADSTPLRIPLKPDEFAGVSYLDYVRNLEIRRRSERNGE
jgi:hypothetical protein